MLKEAQGYAMKSRTMKVTLGLAGAALLALSMGACSSQQDSGTTGASNAVSMKFDLAQCQQISPSLYKCPALDKPVCDPGYSQTDVTCVKVDKTGVVIQQFK